MEIQPADLRSPFERAYSFLRSSGSPNQEVEDELSILVVELARKYFGISSEVFIESALQAAVSIINEGLLMSTAGRVSDSEWADVLKAKGVRGIVGEVTSTIKGLASQLHRLEKFSSVPDIANEKLRCFLNVSSTRGWQRSHSWLNKERNEAQKQNALQDLLEWLQNNTKVGRVYKQKEKDFPELLLPDETLNYIVSRCCGIPAKHLDTFGVVEDLLKKNTLPKEFEPHRDILLPPKIFKEARLLYNELTERLPTRLKLVLHYNGKDWFERHVFLLPPRNKVNKTKTNPLVAEKSPKIKKHAKKRQK